MQFKRFIEIGRVAYIAYGPSKGKLIVIVDVIDQNRVLVDGPCTAVKRQAVNIKQLHLTKFVIKMPYGLRTGLIKKIWEKEEIEKKWAKTVWAKKIASKKLRENLSDFDRFKLMKMKQARNRLINTEFGNLKKKTPRVPIKKRKPNKVIHEKKIKIKGM
ncbi:DgyrCDS8941 [Dimorphilus gyrociliatus]|uniref:Large ribosomal subunit protein eL14 n=1 Tax=Dimorphilus gyrociliatus TaxID=2664684 RepID=A0A7I8VWU7_9ANNE|nr:DgyrCDS8941 [Dimorphilus gyrociliatus]